ncbi:hypothetical protein [Paenibacillus chitinolyticus]
MNGLKFISSFRNFSPDRQDDREKRRPSLERAPLLVFVPHGIYAGWMKRRMTMINHKLFGMRARNCSEFLSRVWASFLRVFLRDFEMTAVSR